MLQYTCTQHLTLKMILALVYFTTTVFVAYPLSNLFINAQKARLLNVPLVYIPFDVNSVIWLLVQPLVWKLLDFLPVNWDSYPDFVRFSHRNWHFLEKSRPIERFGRVWALVSPGGVHLHVSDPDSIEEMFSRWKDFVRPLEKYSKFGVTLKKGFSKPFVDMLTIFGPSVFNVGLEDWPRHRKAISAPFNASTLGFAWAETLRQTELVCNPISIDIWKTKLTSTGTCFATGPHHLEERLIKCRRTYVPFHSIYLQHQRLGNRMISENSTTRKTRKVIEILFLS